MSFHEIIIFFFFPSIYSHFSTLQSIASSDEFPLRSLRRASRMRSWTVTGTVMRLAPGAPIPCSSRWWHRGDSAGQLDVRVDGVPMRSQTSGDPQISWRQWYQVGLVLLEPDGDGKVHRLPNSWHWRAGSDFINVLLQRRNRWVWRVWTWTNPLHLWVEES